MIVLTIDTSQLKALVSLVRDDQILGERRIAIVPTLSRSLLGAIEELLREQNLPVRVIDRIVVEAGPAVRTSALRAGVTVANLLAYAAEAEVAAPATLSVGFVAPKYA